MKKRVLTWLIVLGLILGAGGCGSDLATGIGIGVGSSAGLTEAQRIAQASKIELAAEVAAARERLAAAGPNEVAAVQKQVAALEGKLAVVQAVEAASNKITEGAARDWTSKEPGALTDNIAWVLGAVVGVWGLWEKRKTQVLEAGVAKFQGISDPATASKLHDTIAETSKRILPKANG